MGRVVDLKTSKAYAEPVSKVWGLPSLVWIGVCLAVAVLYMFVWPQQKVSPDTALARYLVLRTFHALVWLLLAVSFWLRGLGGAAAANGVALSALLAYLVFIATFLTS